MQQPESSDLNIQHQHYMIPDNYLIAITKDGDGDGFDSYWFAKYLVHFAFNPKTKTFRLYFQHPRPGQHGQRKIFDISKTHHAYPLLLKMTNLDKIED